MVSKIELEKKLALMSNSPELFKKEIAKVKKELAELSLQPQDRTPWETVKLARNPLRPVLQDYLGAIFTDFTEFHGDRRFSDDKAIASGFARIGGEPVMVVGHNKGKTIEENIERNFGCALPDGYRKALRMMQLAERFNVPIITFIDTQGAFPGLEAEERGQAEAIARNLVEMARIKVPIICVVVGEGGSGGALGIGVGDRILMLSNAVYSVISPEGCAGILWRDGTKAPIAAAALKPTAPSLKELDVIDRIIEEPTEGAHTDYDATFAAVKKAILEELKGLKKVPKAKLTKRRFEKFSKMGIYNE
ncbi:acetyl-CoA carboxylase carboxyltransferase subunit alpha [Spirochaeta isovalerica]|uniref:Acetyl-coenzyme A carboxylase carboxyl transferase subunit alpha n=1 Tax=Spirochaeta isovalerica TaxID=150 RepID=A0A841RFV7_9SPIO|nr:acetyl-CoA carboxylase carboxyltransferase subunit alpha [Spirochaeta isovalerica]MBB6481438.1 acetyl-CoA carboxylase carboxyl transferase subunit alpha [Spirochaeta isovalerica]